MAGSTADNWADPGAYHGYIGRWSRAAALTFVDWLGVPRQSAWLDVGCGTGALTQAILERCDPARVDAFDTSPHFVEFAARAIADGRASFRLADACQLPCADESFDAVVSGLVLNVVPDRARALSEFVRSAKPGAAVGVYVWDFDGEMQMLRYFWEAAKALTPDADRDRDVSGFVICNPARLKEALTEAGLRDVETRAIGVPTRFADFDDYWTPLLRGTTTAQAHVASLDDKKRALLRDRIRSSLPISGDGSISLVARAWAAKGSKSPASETASARA